MRVELGPIAPPATLTHGALSCRRPQAVLTGGTVSARVGTVEALQVLFDEAGPSGELPELLRALYGGDLALDDDLFYANMITSMDGVAALAAPRGAGPTLRGDCDADRFVMALLRALADAVMIGAGTLRADRNHLWTPGYVDREHADAFRSIGRSDPRLVVVTASGALDPGERALQSGALVITTDAGARRLGNRLPAACTVRSLGATAPSGRMILDAVRAEGHRRILTEGGPTILSRLVTDRVLDELFMTVAPVLAGRRSGDGRLGLVEGGAFLPEAGRWARLLSLRKAGSHLFLRYSFRSGGR